MLQLVAGIWSGSPLLSSQIHSGVMDGERDGKGADQQSLMSFPFFQLRGAA